MFFPLGVGEEGMVERSRYEKLSESLFTSPPGEASGGGEVSRLAGRREGGEPNKYSIQRKKGQGIDPCPPELRLARSSPFQTDLEF